MVEIVEEDPRLGVSAGEKYVAEVYRLDPEKVTLLYRVPDGFNPECNQYKRNIRWISWASRV